jgi:hypothetical protein
VRPSSGCVIQLPVSATSGPSSRRFAFESRLDVDAPTCPRPAFPVVGVPERRRVGGPLRYSTFGGCYVNRANPVFDPAQASFRISLNLWVWRCYITGFPWCPLFGSQPIQPLYVHLAPNILHDLTGEMCFTKLAAGKVLPQSERPRTSIEPSKLSEARSGPSGV